LSYLPRRQAKRVLRGR